MINRTIKYLYLDEGEDFVNAEVCCDENTLIT